MREDRCKPALSPPSVCRMSRAALGAATGEAEVTSWGPQGHFHTSIFLQAQDPRDSQVLRKGTARLLKTSSVLLLKARAPSGPWVSLGHTGPPAAGPAPQLSGRHAAVGPASFCKPCSPSSRRGEIPWGRSFSMPGALSRGRRHSPCVRAIGVRIPGPRRVVPPRLPPLAGNLQVGQGRS